MILTRFAQLLSQNAYLRGTQGENNKPGRHISNKITDAMISNSLEKKFSFFFNKALARASGRSIVLDMDWYRCELGRFWDTLPVHPEFRKHFLYIRVQKHEIITPESENWAIDYVKQHVKSIEDVISFNFSGFSVWQIAKGSILAQVNVPSYAHLTNDHLDVALRFFADVVTLLKFVPELFRKLSPAAVIVYEGARAYSRAIIEVARLCGVNPIAIANNALRPGYLYFDNLTGMIVNRHRLAKCGRELMEVRTFAEEQRKKAFETWQNGIAGKMDQHKTGGVDTIDEIRQKLDLPADKPVALFLAHVRNDTSVIYDSPLYEDPVDCITDIIELFASKFRGWILVVRLHPKEAGGSAPGGHTFNYETKQELERRGFISQKNIRIVEEKIYNTFTLMNMAKIGITEVSQSGHEMAMLGKPVVTVGEASYGRKGFTWDVSHDYTLSDIVSHALKCSDDNSICSRIREKALNFAYMLFFEELVADDLSENSEKVIRTLKGY